MDGWFSVWRKLFDNDLWLSETFTRGQAWIDLIGLANHDDGYIRIRGNKVPVLRGQVGWSETKLQERWKWSRGKVRRFLKELKAEQQIEQQTNNITSLITITNYDIYQCNGTAGSTAGSTADGQQTDSRQYPNNKDNKDNKVNNPPIVPPKGDRDLEFKTLFDTARKRYPGTKRGLDTEWANFKKKVKDWKAWLEVREGRCLLEAVIEHQDSARDSRKRREGWSPSWPNFSTWINQRRFEEYLDD